MLGVWIDPVTAQLMMTFSDRFIENLQVPSDHLVHPEEPSG